MVVSVCWALPASGSNGSEALTVSAVGGLAGQSCCWLATHTEIHTSLAFLVTCSSFRVHSGGQLPCSQALAPGRSEQAASKTCLDTLQLSVNNRPPPYGTNYMYADTMVPRSLLAVPCCCLTCMSRRVTRTSVTVTQPTDDAYALYT